MNRPAEPSVPRRARDVCWFDPRDYPAGKQAAEPTPGARSYGSPIAYLVGLVALPIAFTLALADPFGWPMPLYGILVFVSGTPGWSMVQNWAEDLGVSAYSGRGLAGQLWLYFGGAVPEAVSTLRARHDS